MGRGNKHSSKSSCASHSSLKDPKQKKGSSLSTKNNKSALKNVAKRTRTFPCSDCAYIGGSSWSLRCHKMSNHTMIITMLLCPDCGHSSGTKELLKKHIQKAHTKLDKKKVLKYPTYVVSYTGRHSGNSQSCSYIFQKYLEFNDQYLL